MVRYYGFYSNLERGKRKKEDNDELIPSIPGLDDSSNGHDYSVSQVPVE